MSRIAAHISGFAAGPCADGSAVDDKLNLPKALSAKKRRPDPRYQSSNSIVSRGSH